MPLSYNNLLDTAFSLYKKAPPGTPLNLAGSFYDLYKSASKPAAQPVTPQTAKIGNGMMAGFESGANSTVAPPKPTPSYSPSYNVSSSNSYNEKSPVVSNQNKVTPNQVANPVPTPSPTPTTQNTSNTPSSNDTSSDIFNIDALKKLYGFSEAPTYQKPDTSIYDAQISSYNPQNEMQQIQANLDSQLNEITKKYQLERESEAKKTENERLGQLSNLYNIGYVNPASSGVSSVGTASNEILNKRLDTLKSMEQAERNDAMSRAYGFKTSAQNTALQLAKEQKANIEKQANDSYTNDRQKWTDSVSQINNIVNLYKSGREINFQDKESAQKTITSLLSHGSAMFNGVPQEELAIMEKAAGYPKGSLVNGLKNLKEKELLDKDGLNLKEINGSLYNIKKDAYGNVIPELIVKGNLTSSSTMPASYKEFELTQSNPDYAQFLNKNKPQTADQLKAEGFANRLQDANTVISQLESTGAKLIGSISGNSFFPNALKSSERQQLEQAERNFVNSVLRRESGAAISPSEFNNATKQYFPQPGDNDEVIKQKSQNRLRAISNFQTESGKAIQNNYDPIDIDELKRNGYSQEQINAFLQQSFNKPLSMGQNGSQEVDIKKFASSIGRFESGGRYNAVGPDTGNGNRALGKYQVMASNVPGWTREALGKSLTPEQFLNSPQAQDIVAHYKMSQHYQKYGNLEDMASAWFSGKPLARAGNARDVIGTSVPSYVKNIRSIYDQLS